MNTKHEPTGFKLKRLTHEEPTMSPSNNREINDANKRLWYRNELRKTNFDPELNTYCGRYHADRLRNRHIAALNDNDRFIDEPEE